MEKFTHLTRAFRMLIVIFLAFTMLSISTPASAGTITVDPGGGGDYTTIQDAINNATPGDTISISAGLYVENIMIDRHVKLIGAGSDADSASNTIITPFDPMTTVDIAASGISAADPLLLQDIRINYLKGNGTGKAAGICVSCKA